MAGQLRTLAGFPEAPSLIPSPQMVAHNSLYSTSKGSEAFFRPPWAPDIHVMHIISIKTLMHTKHF